MVGSLATTSEVKSMAISSELIYLGCRGGIVEVWDQKKQNRIEILQTRTNGKVLCMTLDANEEVLVIGTSDGQIQVTKTISSFLNLQKFTKLFVMIVNCQSFFFFFFFLCRHGN